MRVLLVLFALVATPFLVSAAQDPNGLKCTNGQSADNRSAQGAAHAHKGVCKPQPPPPPVLDTDLDGVPDNLDKCPGTPTGTTVDASGCAVQPPVQDTDLDGVPDNLDKCPGTPTGTTVDASGCAVQPPTPTCPVSQLSLGTGTIEGNVYNTALSWPNNGLGNWCIHVTGVTETGATVEAMQLTGASGYYLFTGLPAGTYTVCEVTEGTTCLTSFFLGDGWGASWNNFYTRPL